MDYAGEFVKWLCHAENRYLETLISRFELVRTKNGGAELRAEFDETTYAIWNNLGRKEVNDRIPNFADKAAKYQAELDAFLLDGQGERYEFNDPDFPFRYASGGALPVLWLDGREYYCLFYREVFPIGWNIANGGCDSRAELLSPLDTMERELREELMIIDPDKQKKRYVFEADVGRSLDGFEFAIARRFWEQRHPQWDLESLEEIEIPTKWLRGPDSLTARLSTVEKGFDTSGCFLNINALDFGIEIDRVVRLTVDRDARLLDGEILTGWVRDGCSLPTTIVNAPIGLFETDRLNSRFRDGCVDFRPDRVFWDGIEQPNTQLETVIDKWLEEIKPWLTEKALAAYYDCRQKFNLCPVTRSIVNRCLQTWFEPDEAPVPKMTPLSVREAPELQDLPYEVFVCSASEDYRLADTVARFLSQKAAEDGRGRPFFCEQCLYHTDFGRMIEEALDSANCLVVVTTHPDHPKKEYPEFEWRSFHVATLNRRKPRNAQLISYVSDFDGRQLPYTLAGKEWVEHDPVDPTVSLERLYRFVRTSFK